MRRRGSSRWIAIVAVAWLVAACGSAGASPDAARTGSATTTFGPIQTDPTSPRPSPSEPRPSPSQAILWPPSAIADGMGVASDEPCSRSIASDAIPAPIGFRADDLERMVLTRDDLGALDGLDVDPFAHGYQGDGEMEMFEVHPDSLCADLQRYGRVLGFTLSRTTPTEPAEQVYTSAQLFWDAAGARDWSEALVRGFEALDRSDASFSFDVEPLASLGRGSALIHHIGRDGTRTWAIVVRGPIVGWVMDRHPGKGTLIDVPAAAAALAQKIDAVIADVADRAPKGLDAAALLSAPLPLAAYGPAFEGLVWDAFFGGCTDTIERGLIAGDQAARDAERFGRVVGCSAMYAPKDGTSVGQVVRVFSSVQVYRDDAGARSAVDAAVAEMTGSGGTATRLGGDTDGSLLVTPPGGERDFTDTRGVSRIGPHTLAVVVQDRDPTDHAPLVRDLAARLTKRVHALLGATVD